MGKIREVGGKAERMWEYQSKRKARGTEKTKVGKGQKRNGRGQRMEVQ